MNATSSPSPITPPKYSPTPRNTPTTPASLLPDSPWFVDIGDIRDDLLVLMHPDETGRWQIMVGSSVYIDSWKDPASSSLDISPLGEWIMLEHDTSSNDDLNYQEKFLSLVHLTDGEVRRLQLFASDFPAGLTENQESEAAGAVGRAKPIWSPNGRYIAYVAVIDGPSDDLYIYDTEGGRRRRLSSGTNHLWLEPGWSPDGKWVVHEEWFNFYHPDEGVWLDTETYVVWAASLDGSQMNRLFNQFDPITGGGHFFSG